MVSSFTQKYIRFHFEVWTAYQLMYYRTATDNTFYDKLFRNNFWNIRPTFKDVEKFANAYWDYKNLIRLAETKEDLKFIIDEISRIKLSYPDFLDMLYLLTSDLYRSKYTSLQDAIDEIVYIYEHDVEPEPGPDPEPEPDPDPKPDDPIEELEIKVLKTIYALSNAINTATLQNYVYSLGNSNTVVITKPYTRLDITPKDIQPSPYIKPAIAYINSYSKLEITVPQRIE